MTKTALLGRFCYSLKIFWNLLKKFLKKHLTFATANVIIKIQSRETEASMARERETVWMSK